MQLSPNQVARNEAVAQLRVIGTAGQMIELEPDDVLTALGEELPLLSINGLYYKTLGVMTRLIRPAGMLFVVLLGVVAAVKIARNAGSVVLRKLRSFGTFVSALVGPGVLSKVSPFGALYPLFQMGAKQDADPESVEDTLIMVRAVIPGPLNSIIDTLDSALDMLGSSSASPSAPVPMSSTSPQAQPANALGLIAPPSTAAPVATPPTAAVTSYSPAVAATTKQVSTWESAAANVLGAAGSAVIDWIFSDEAASHDDDGSMKRVAALCVAAGVPPEAIKNAVTGIRSDEAARDERFTSSW